jgi:predicted ATP-dependent endonuclease of OLD family
VKLKTIKVTNFRSVEDSGDLPLVDVTCLVGKNEAGKSAILQAIAGLNPDPLTPVVYDKERDYPRRFLTEYKIRHPSEEAVVIASTWELEAPEKALIEAEFGDAALISSPITILRRYDSPKPE